MRPRLATDAAVTDADRTVAEICALGGHTLGGLRERLADAPGLDDGFEHDVAETLALVSAHVPIPGADA
ncbi:hypothetical protein [Antribacter gilvus]|uniref:hypothetical protein n=1 Tax=Antribacter gilvus TaxID=2304675 RepID=UPI000F782CC1|nr:hypothetical protein [Antribacter gilvus]